MGYLDNHINNLLDLECRSTSKDCFFLSFYLPVANLNNKEIQQQIKSLLHEGFIKIDATQQIPEHLRKTKEDLIPIFENKINELSSPQKGLAGFAVFNPDKKPDDEGDEIIIVSIRREPFREISISRVFDLDQLVWLNYIETDALFLSLNRNEAKFWTVNGNSANLIKQVKNEYLIEEDKEHLEEYSPTKGSSIIHGTGSNKTDIRAEKRDEHFLDDLKELLKKDALTSGHKYLVISFSNYFRNSIDQLISELKTIFPKMIITTTDKSLSDKDKIFTETQEIINQITRETINKELSKAKENYSQYLDNFEDITKASRDRNIFKLFFKPDLEKPGWIESKDYIFTEKRPQGRKVKNILPWLVKNVIESGGEIYLLPEEDKENYSVNLNIAGLTRWAEEKMK